MARCEAQAPTEAPERSEATANPQFTAINDATTERKKDKPANDATDYCESSNPSDENKA